MKKGAVPELSHKWWAKNKAKTLGKTGLGKALKNFEVAEELNDPKRMLKALSEVKKKLMVALKACNNKTHKETKDAIKKYTGVIQKREGPLKKRAAEPSAAAPALKQKKGKLITIWALDVSKAVLSKYSPDWLKSFKGLKLELVLDDGILDILEKEGDVVTPQQMIGDAQNTGKETVDKIVKTLKTIDAKTKGKPPKEVAKIRATFQDSVNDDMKSAKAEMLRIPKARWAAYTKIKTQYKAYKASVAKSSGKEVGGIVISAVGIATSGGASLALGIVAIVRSVAKLSKEIYMLALEAEAIEKKLERDLKHLTALYGAKKKENAGKKSNKLGRNEVAGSVLKGILKMDAPFINTVSYCNKNYQLWQLKAKGMSIEGRKLSASILKTLTACEKLEKQLKNANSKDARKILDQLRKGRASLDASLNNCSTMMKRVADAQVKMRELKKLLDPLNEKNPKYAEIFDKTFPKVLDVALMGASAGVNLDNVAATMKSIGKGLAEFNKIAAVGRPSLVVALG